MTADVVVYVSKSGNDISGDGTATAPYATVQAAVNSLPKFLDGHTAEISIGQGTYAERVMVVGFTGGRLVIGRSGEKFTLNGITIEGSSFVETNINRIEKSSGDTQPLYVVKGGSSVRIGSTMVLDGVNASSNGLLADTGSTVAATASATLTVNNCSVALTAQWCSFVSLTTINGSGSIFGMVASQGSIVSFKTDALDIAWSNAADTGGLVLTGVNSTNLSDATLDL